MRKTILIGCTFLIALLFIYTATAKLLDLRQFRYEMLNQPLPHWLSGAAVWGLPSFEILTVVFLFTERTRLTGLWLAWSLFFLFTIYASLILANTFGRTPCGCGGFIKHLTWIQHLWFNIFFLVVASVGVVVQCQLEILKIFHAPETGQTENL